MRIFVTGASGFVGTRLLPFLTAAGHDVTGADREIDVTDAARLEAAIASTRPEVVVHLAAMSSVAQSWREPERCQRLNVLGTGNLLEAVESKVPDARVLLIGSADQYSPSAEPARPLDETAPENPRSPYARSKSEAEALGLAAAGRGLDVVRLRAFNHTGRGQSDQFVVSSFARQVAAIRLGRQEPVMRVGNLESVRDFLHVDDVLRAYRALVDPAVPAGVYNVASGRSTSIQEILDWLIAIAGIAPRVERDPDRFRPTDWLVGDASKLRAATGWRPEIDLDQILHELFEDWLAREGAAT